MAMTETYRQLAHGQSATDMHEISSMVSAGPSSAPNASAVVRTSSSTSATLPPIAESQQQQQQQQQPHGRNALAAEPKSIAESCATEGEFSTVQARSDAELEILEDREYQYRLLAVQALFRDDTICSGCVCVCERACVRVSAHAYVRVRVWAMCRLMCKLGHLCTTVDCLHAFV